MVPACGHADPAARQWRRAYGLSASGHVSVLHRCNAVCGAATREILDRLQTGVSTLAVVRGYGRSRISECTYHGSARHPCILWGVSRWHLRAEEDFGYHQTD